MPESTTTPKPRKPRLRGEKVPWYTPLVWSGMPVAVWLHTLLRGRFWVRPSRWVAAGIMSLFAIGNSYLRWRSEWRHRRQAESTAVRPPLFVLGHWRSGTTMLHELLVLDEQFSFPTTYDCLAPHHFLYSVKRFAWIMDALSPKRRPMDDMPVGMHLPQEDEFGLCNLGLGSPYLTWAFPETLSKKHQWLDLESLPAKHKRKWQDTMLWFARRLTLRDQKRIVFKSPTHTARIRALLEIFPDAQFIHIVRNPYKLLPSTVHTWSRLTDSQLMQSYQPEHLREGVLRRFVEMYEAFDRDRPGLSPQQFCEIRFEELLASPAEVVASVYQQLQLGDFEQVRPKLDAYFEERKTFRANRFASDDSLDDLVTRRWGRWIEQFGYELRSAAE